MRRTFLVQFLLIMLISFFIFNLSADKTNQDKLEAKLRADTEFNGSITWWNDDTIKEMHGWFDSMDISSYDDAELVAETIEDIFRSLVPYTGFKPEDFNVVNIEGNSFLYRQIINERFIDQFGYIEIVNDVDNSELGIWICPLLNVNAPLTPVISKASAYRIYTQQADAWDVLNEVDSNLYLIYKASSSYIYSAAEKPRNLDLVWFLKGTDDDYFVDAISGKLSKRIVFEN